MNIAKRAFLSIATLLIGMTILCTSALADMEGTGSVDADTTGSSGIVSVFPDVPANAEYAEAVATLNEVGIITGDEQGNFNPDKTITRAEAATIICRLMGVEDEAKTMKKQVFTDVPSSHWAVGYVVEAVELGIVDGYGNGKFGPEDPVTYEQMIKMLVCAWGYEDWAAREGGWPNGYLSVAEQCGISEGISFVPTNAAPRRDIAILAYQMLFVSPSSDFE